MVLLLIFLALILLTALLFWWLTRLTGYKVRNRDVRPHYSSRTRRERPGPDLSKMLD